MSSRPERACGVRTAGRGDDEMMRRRREETERAVRIRLSCEELAQRAVERLLERNITAGELLECGSRILPSHYEDVVEERSIEHLCGYPLCNNALVNVPKQRYAISVRSNRVYDITRRKSFCSNFCMRASNSFLAQIPSSPMWHRPHEPTPNFKLLRDGESGLPGEEVRLSVERLSLGDVEQPPTPPPTAAPHAAPHTAPHGTSSGDDDDDDDDDVEQPPTAAPHTAPHAAPHGTSSGDDDDDVEEVARPAPADPCTQKLEVAVPPPPCCRPPPLVSVTTATTAPPRDSRGISRQGAAALAAAIARSRARAPLSPRGTAAAAAAAPAPPCPLAVEGAPAPGDAAAAAGGDGVGVGVGAVEAVEAVEAARRVLSEWATRDAVALLLRRDAARRDERLDEDDLPAPVTAAVAAATAAAAAVRATRGTVGSGGAACPPPPPPPAGVAGVAGVTSRPVPDYAALRRDTRAAELRVTEFYGGRLAPHGSGGDEEEVDEEEDYSVVVPAVDSISQCLIRRRLVVQQLNGALPAILAPMQLSLREIAGDISSLVLNLRLSPTNIVHRAATWTLIALALLHGLAVRGGPLGQAWSLPASRAHVSKLLDRFGLHGDPGDLDRRFLHLLPPS